MEHCSVNRAGFKREAEGISEKINCVCVFPSSIFKSLLSECKWRFREVIHADLTICSSKVNKHVVFPPGHTAKAVDLTESLLLKWNIMSTCVLKLIYSTHDQGFGLVKRNSCSIFFPPCSFHWVCSAKWVGTVSFWRRRRGALKMDYLVSQCCRKVKMVLRD